MFGYIRPNIPELRVREKHRYDAWYCGLCRRLGKRLGQASRFVLSYDGAFLALLLSAVTGEDSPCEKHRCPVRPLAKKKAMVAAENAALDYAADVCVMLAKFKLKDDMHDGRPWRGAAGLPLIRAFSKAKRHRPELYAEIESGLSALSELEKAKKPSPELAANAFGEIMRSIMKNAPINDDAGHKLASVLSELGFYIGRTVYLIDAWDDRAEDEKRALYNPFNLSSATRDDAEFSVVYSINSAISAYNLVEPYAKTAEGAGLADAALIENIISQGLFAAWDAVLEKSAANNKTNNKTSKKGQRKTTNERTN